MTEPDRVVFVVDDDASLRESLKDLIGGAGLGSFKILLKSAIRLFAFFDLIGVINPQQVKKRRG